MKRFTLIVLLSMACHAQVGPYLRQGATGAVYYISTSGNDANPGTQASPWLSPLHAVNCGDTIIALAGTTYSYTNFTSAKWGTVTCASGNRVAWLMCATFDQCKISGGSGGGGILVTASYWGVQGWEVTNSGNAGPCFGATPASSAASIHHIIFANDVANGCGAGGFSVYNNGTAGVDYAAVVGSIAYNAAQNNTNCYSGISFYQPVASDSNSGAHLAVIDSFSYGNIDPATCHGTAPTDGEGAIFDTFDGCPGGGACTGGTGAIYTQTAVMANNILVSNGGRGAEYQTYTKGTPAHPTVYRYNNTIWANSQDPNQNTNLCNEMDVNIGYGITDTLNIIKTTATTACTSHTLYGSYCYDCSSSNVTISGNWFAAASGSHTGSFNDDSNTFAFGTNTTGTDPAFSAPSPPTAPSCGSSANTVACMGTVISNFTPTAMGTAGYGYQAPLTSNGSDTHFPKWLCSAGLPGGIATFTC